MRKLPKRPRTFGRTKAKPYPPKRKRQSRFINARIARFFDEMIDRPALYWHINYDEYGKYVSTRITGLLQARKA